MSFSLFIAISESELLDDAIDFGFDLLLGGLGLRALESFGLGYASVV